MASGKRLTRRRVGELPLIQSFADRMNLRSVLSEFLPQQTNEKMAPSDVLMLLITNLAIGRSPLYELEGWVHSLDPRCFGKDKWSDEDRFTDDRFGKALDQLYAIDRASLMTRIVLEAVAAFQVDLSQINNDSTTVKACGKYSGQTGAGFELRRGKSKDHRPDLKQLLFSLSISADGAVPIHCKTYPGNRTDDTTHIETWDTLCKITQSPDFLYVADCKVCTDVQLCYITENEGRVVTIIPETWSEVKTFKGKLRKEDIPKKEIWRKEQPRREAVNYFYLYQGDYLTTKRGYRIHWICSSEKRKTDRICREGRLKKAERKLKDLLPRINQRKLKRKESITIACKEVLKRYRVEKFIKISVGQTAESRSVQKGKGRPGKNTEYKIIEKIIYTLSWSRDGDALKAERNVDGVFPLLSTKLKMTAREALVAYKYQPRLEKRFTQLKSVHNAAPLLFKKLERIEANMFLFFVALMVQALIEREVRNKMKTCDLVSLPVYPENRDSVHPTTSKVFDIFRDISTYALTDDDDVIEEYSDSLTNTQRSLLHLLGISGDQYWNGISVSDHVDSCLMGGQI